MDNQPGNQTNPNDTTTNPSSSEEHQGGFEPVTEPEQTTPDVPEEDDNQHKDHEDHQDEVETDDEGQNESPGPR
ncbi:MAG: hypothetical protein Q8M40_01735 [Legionella sp.]|nr:hypothetical protein [Legionella sp.]